MRIVAGELRGRQIIAPKGTVTRPTTDKARQATFNALGSLNTIIGAKVVDLFAGSGALGIEALSRGAAHCTFVERDRLALEALRTNIEALDLGDRTSVIRGDALVYNGTIPDVSLVLADPPYEFAMWSEILSGSTASLVVAESNRELGSEIATCSDWEVIRSKRYGRAFVTFIQRIPYKP
ncbi:MAG: 16S rRNA (guanine(966)-N(2))-methyltransferase RsmD [Ilumatobacteraceae bacterium]